MVAAAASPPQELIKRGIGASEAAVAIGVSAYRRPIQAWLEKTGRAPAFAGNEQTRWGHLLEGSIRKHYVDLHNVRVHVPPTSLFHRELPFVRATPDGVVLAADDTWAYVGPQVKNIGWRMVQAWQDEEKNRVAPIDYYIQGVVEMAVTDLGRIDFAVLANGSEYFEVTIERDRGLEADVLEQLAAFWRCIEEDRAPELDDSDAYRAHLLGSIKKQVTIEAAPADAATIERWREVVVQAKKLELEEKALKTRLAARLAEAGANRLSSDAGDIKVTAGRRTTGWKAVAEATGGAVLALAQVERDLAAIRSLTGGEGELAERLDALRAQVRLFQTLSGAGSVAELVKTHTAQGAPVLKRPNAWTKDLDIDTTDESEEG